MTLISPLAQLEVGSKFYRVKHNHMWPGGSRATFANVGTGEIRTGTLEWWVRPRRKVWASPHMTSAKRSLLEASFCLASTCTRRESWGNSGQVHTALERLGECHLSWLHMAIPLPNSPSLGTLSQKCKSWKFFFKGKNPHPLVTRNQKYRYFKTLCVYR